MTFKKDPEAIRVYDETSGYGVKNSKDIADDLTRHDIYCAERNAFLTGDASGYARALDAVLESTKIHAVEDKYGGSVYIERLEKIINQLKGKNG